jgi:hypothetical protein
MDNTKLPKHALYYKPRGRTSRGRRRNRWMPEQAKRPNAWRKVMMMMMITIIIIIEILSRKFNFHSNQTTITATLHKDQNTFMITSRSVLLRMRNVSGKKKTCTENQNTHFVFSNIFPKIVPFME